MDSFLTSGLFALFVVALVLALVAMCLVSAEKSPQLMSRGLSGRGRRLLQQ